MREKDINLAKQCQNWSDAALACQQWLLDNKESAGSECGMLCKSMRSASRALRRLSTAAERKMCLAVFGASQAGKSYLISALARDRNGELMAGFAGQQVDFISRINPEGGKESTGLVTRFTTTPPEGVTSDFPVRLRLFSELDLVRVFANTYYCDCQHDDTPDEKDLLSAMKDLSMLKKSEPVAPFTKDDMEDLRDYMQRFRASARAQMLNRAYWKQAIELAPMLDLAGRARLYSLIWNGVADFTTCFLALASALEKLGHAPEASCSLDALLPREKSIIDVDLLDPSREGASEEITLLSDKGPRVPLKRCHVTALTAELTIYMPESPAPFFEYTDLLDFPGYRSRFTTTNLEATLADKHQLQKFFLRGKVAYLFERYCEERELTGMLLCVGPGNQDVQVLPQAIENWINLTQGATPDERRKSDPMLFFCLTKIDLEFEEKKGVVDAGERWQTRIQASLTDFFGRVSKWPDNWDGRPFNNLFLIRNPNVTCDIFVREGGEETGLNPSKIDLVSKVRQSFFGSDLVRQHFASPQEAWDAAMSLNDGGIGLLRKKLAPICDPDRKYNQTLARANEKARELRNALARFYRSDDLKERAQAQSRKAQGLISVLAQLIQTQRFADFLSRFLVSDQDLFDMARALDMDNSASEPRPIAGMSTSADDVMNELFGDAGEFFSAAPQAQPAVQPAQKEAKTDAKTMDQVESFCHDALDHWIKLVQDQRDNPAMQSVYNLPQSFMEMFASELIQGTNSARLLQNMSSSIRSRCSFLNITPEVAAWRMASEAAYRINSYVSWLGHDARLGEETNILFGGRQTDLFQPVSMTFGPCGEPVVPEQQTQFDKPYYLDWLKAFFNRVVDNAACTEENFNPLQNSRLGDLLDKLMPVEAEF